MYLSADYGFRLEGKTARDVLVNSGIIDHNQHYWLATSSWIANGGEDFKALAEHVENGLNSRFQFGRFISTISAISD